MSDLKDEVTPKNFYLNRRTFLKTSIYAATTAGTTLAYRHFRPLKKEPGGETSQVEAPEATAYKSIIGYNNFYEFSTDKEEVAGAAAGWKFQDWNLEIGGLVEKPCRGKLRSPISSRKRVPPSAS